MMLKFLKIKNFQSHKHTELEFSKGINAIVGNSTSGKTAIFRALQWLVNNRPLGNRFKSIFANEDESVFVEAEFSGGEKISLKKDDKEAVYSIIDSSGNKDSFKGIGSDVPDLVRKYINLDEINIQNQLDQHFLITSSPGEVARAINKIVHLEKVDDWISSATSQINAINKQIKLKEEDKEKFAKELSELPDVDKLEGDIVCAEELYRKASEKKEKIKAIDGILSKLVPIEEEIDIIKKWLGVEAYISDVSAICKEIDLIKSKYELIEQFVSISKNIDKARELILNASRDIDDCVKINNRIAEVSDKISALYKLVDGYNIIEKEMKRESQLLNELKEKYQSYKSSLLKSGVCPLCSSKITKEKMDEISAYF